jgi:hypothetical protein
MAVTDHNIHVLTHTARMQQVLTRDPAHTRREAYEAKLAEYKAHWAEISPDDRDQIAGIIRLKLNDESTSEMSDITDVDVTAARTVLEG